MRARSKYGPVDRNNPEAAGRCDRGGEIRKRSELIKEMRYAGKRLVPTGFYCCARHIDLPQPQDFNITLPIDPVPVDNPRLPIDWDNIGPRNIEPLTTDDLLTLTDDVGKVLYQ